MHKKLLFVVCFMMGSTLLLAQNGGLKARQGGPHLPGTVPGQQSGVGQTVQISPMRAGADTGGLDPASITKPLTGEWQSYSGDLSGKRFSALKLVNTNTVKNLSLKWITPLMTGCGPTGEAAGGGAGGFGGFGGGGRGGGGGFSAPIIVGGLGTGE